MRPVVWINLLAAAINVAAFLVTGGLYHIPMIAASIIVALCHVDHEAAPRIKSADVPRLEIEWWMRPLPEDTTKISLNDPWLTDRWCLSGFGDEIRARNARYNFVNSREPDVPRLESELSAAVDPPADPIVPAVYTDASGYGSSHTDAPGGVQAYTLPKTRLTRLRGEKKIIDRRIREIESGWQNHFIEDGKAHSAAALLTKLYRKQDYLMLEIKKEKQAEEVTKKIQSFNMLSAEELELQLKLNMEAPY